MNRRTFLSSIVRSIAFVASMQMGLGNLTVEEIKDIVQDCMEKTK